MAWTCTNDRPHYAYIAPYKNQAKIIAWDYLKKFSAPLNPKINEVELSIEFMGVKIYVFGADNPDAIRGIYLDGVVLDEFAQFRPEVYQQVIRPALADRKGWALFIGTPKGQNQFFEIYQLAQKMVASGNSQWWCGLYRADETGVVSQDELDQIKAVISDASYRQEFLCDFTAAADNVLITIDLVTQATKKTYKPGDVMDAPRVIGVDVARFGDDKSVIFRRQGLQAFTPRVLSGVDNMTLVGNISAEINDFNPDAVFIDAGRGEGVIDRLRQLGYKIIEVNFGSSPTNHVTYANKRVEMWDHMKAWLQAGGAIPNMPDLKTDLVVPTYDFDAANRMRLESKEKIKERLGKSPDLADALAITFAYPIKKETNPVQNKKLEFAKRDYDILTL